MKMLRVALTASGALALAACGPGDGPVEEAVEEVDNVIEPQVEGEPVAPETETGDDEDTAEPLQ